MELDVGSNPPSPSQPPPSPTSPPFSAPPSRSQPRARLLDSGRTVLAPTRIHPANSMLADKYSVTTPRTRFYPSMVVASGIQVVIVFICVVEADVTLECVLRTPRPTMKRTGITRIVKESCKNHPISSLPVPLTLPLSPPLHGKNISQTLMTS